MFIKNVNGVDTIYIFPEEYDDIDYLILSRLHAFHIHSSVWCDAVTAVYSLWKSSELRHRQRRSRRSYPCDFTVGTSKRLRIQDGHDTRRCTRKHDTCGCGLSERTG